MIEQYGVCKHKGRKDVLLLNVQHGLLQDLKSRLVIPLVPIENFGKPATRLNPIFTIDKQDYVMDTANMAGFPVSRCGEKVVSLDNKRETILSAIDFLLCGF